ncbi:MAG: class I SAM-dependent methyltransferase [Sulfuricaulis sp.]
MNTDKKAVHDFWDSASCGEELYLAGYGKDDFLRQAEIRYQLEPYILEFTGFEQYRGKKVLEIGVGLGADHQKFAEAGAVLTGVDLTQRAIDHTRRRFQVFSLNSELRTADAENLPFEDETFDLVYSWGVLHHSPDTPKTLDEVFRVLKPGGKAKIMVYYKYSFVGFMLWIRYALFRLRPFTSLRSIYGRYLESPGTKAYSISEVKELFNKFRTSDARAVLTHGDLLASSAGQRHQGTLLNIARMIWPRWFIRAFFPNNGLFLLITAIK